MPDVQHQPDQNRFAAEVDGGTAELAYQHRGDAVAFIHTFVPEPARGQGVGEALAAAGLAWAREEGLGVIPQCAFVAQYIEAHPEEQDLVQR